MLTRKSGYHYLGVRKLSALILESGYNRSDFYVAYTQIQRLMHTLSLELLLKSDATNQGKAFSYILRYEWQTTEPGNQNHCHKLIKNDRTQQENAEVVTSDERDLLKACFETNNLNE